MSDQKTEQKTLKPGDIVRVADPSRYIVSFAKKIENRDARVLWVGPTPSGMYRGYAGVMFLKRNGRGKEFKENIRIADLVLQEPRHD